MRSLSILAALALAFTAACGNNNNTPKDAPMADAAVGGADASCFTNPTTNDEIINACTTAQKIYVTTPLPLLGSDGSLPPLP